MDSDNSPRWLEQRDRIAQVAIRHGWHDQFLLLRAVYPSARLFCVTYNTTGFSGVDDDGPTTEEDEPCDETTDDALGSGSCLLEGF